MEFVYCNRERQIRFYPLRKVFLFFAILGEAALSADSEFLCSREECKCAKMYVTRKNGNLDVFVKNRNL